MNKEYQMGSSRTIEGDTYMLITTAKNLDEAKQTVRFYLGILEKGHKVTWLEDEGIYLIYSCRPHYPTLDEILANPGSPPMDNRPIYHRRKRLR